MLSVEKRCVPQQQAFTRAGNSPQPAHLLGSTEDEAENAGFGVSCRSRQKTTFCLSLGAQGCHGNGFNYTLSFIAEIFHWETIKKTFSDLIPEVLEKELASVLLLPVSTRDKKSKY